MENYIARIIENGNARQAKCSGRTPGDALFWLVKAAHIRKGAAIKLGCAYWEGDRFVQHVYEYRHTPEHASAWELAGTDRVQYVSAKPE